jgi:hypothetical protein
VFEGKMKSYVSGLIFLSTCVLFAEFCNLRWRIIVAFVFTAFALLRSIFWECVDVSAVTGINCYSFRG